MTDHDLDDLKDRLCRAFGVQVRDDLQVRAEIIIQAEPGRWAFTPNELSDLLEGLNAILQHSKPDAGWPFRLTLKQYIGLFTPIIMMFSEDRHGRHALVAPLRSITAPVIGIDRREMSRGMDQGSAQAANILASSR